MRNPFAETIRRSRTVSSLAVLVVLVGSVGLRTAGPGDLEAQLNGVSPLIGLFQQVTISGWITSATTNGGTVNFLGDRDPGFG